MRLLPRTATMWQQASSRLALKLVPFRVLARTFAPISTTIPYIKHLHDDTKKPDPDRESKIEDLPADDKLELKAQGLAADFESNLEHAAPEVPEDNAENTAIQKGKKRVSDALRAARLVNLAKGFETQRAAGYPNLQKAREAQRAAGFPNLKKYREAQRAAGYPHAKRNFEARRASLRAGHERYYEEQSALGHEEYRKRRHAKLLLDIEAANKRKLAEDPTFIPNPLPDLESLPRTSYPARVGTVPCPEPGCDAKLFNERTLASHVLRMHSRYSIDTPHKCKDPSCNKYFPTKQWASKHFSATHARPKPACPICDRVYCSPDNLKRHLLLIHGVSSPSA